MAKIDPRLVELLKKYGEDNSAVWDCHGTWVAYHAAIERMAAKAGIKFDPPQMIVNDYEKGIVVVMVSATNGVLNEWSFGEVSPKNNKNAYPYAMAEKRAKDRAALKLLGMAGLVYSEEEADDFKAAKPAPAEPANDDPKKISAAEQKRQLEQVKEDLVDATTVERARTVFKVWREIAQRDGWSKDYWQAAADMINAKAQELKAQEDTVSDIQDEFPGSRVVNEHVRQDEFKQAGE